MADDTPGLSDAARAWLDEQRVTPFEVMARVSREAEIEDAREERERSQKLSAFQVAREDAADMMRFRGETMPTLGDRSADWALAAEVEEWTEENTRSTRAERLAEERAIAQADRIAQLERELEQEQHARRRARRLADDRLIGLVEARTRAERAEQGSYSQPQGYRVRNSYWG